MKHYINNEQKQHLCFAAKKLWSFVWVNCMAGLEWSGSGMAILCHYRDISWGKMDDCHVPSECGMPTTACGATQGIPSQT